VYLFDWRTSASQFFTLGLYAPKWQHAKYPKLPSAGRFEYEVFDPRHWVGDYPNAAFRNENPADRAWAARKIRAFTDEEIRAIVSMGGYSDPAAEEWVARCLIERRKKIVDAFLTGTAGLDGFEVRGERLDFNCAGPESAAAPVTVQWSIFDNEGGQHRFLGGPASLELPKVTEPADYLVAELSGTTGPAISVYVRTNGERQFVVGVERHFAADARK
jgi:hypothetical protein